ncbi:MAG: 50S ribosomal protein L9 [Bacilli bacterium]|nr:50S ribosomal protein L9 [Bacilli bacterium]
MKVILLQDVKKQGKKDDIINVSDGYAHNFLFKQNLAVPYTETSKNVLDKQIKKRNDEEDALVESLNEIKKKLENRVIKFKVKTGKNDQVFGAISTKQISDEIKKLGFNIDKKNIKTNTNIDSLGVHNVLIELHKKVKFEIQVMLEK